ncbi:MAG: bifunctional riboflavin kinase/FAD synthetase [Candidatus Omnitrophota bacterium]|nr:bifunctional riboflavin kinase/FAD synthetase [Candidatus Omnitrophota bacterium]
MRVIYGVNKIRKFPNPVVALGVFDGVHLGHKRILQEAVSTAKKIKGTSIILTFDPHPQSEDSICSLEHRLNLISRIGLDVCIVIRFDKRFSQVTARDFMVKILYRRINPRYLLVGKNFTFGRNAQGDFNLLKKFSQRYNFKLKAFDIVKIGSRPVSSTYIRNLILAGKLNEAGRLLSRPVNILGEVARGESLGKVLGFPTANIDPHHEIIPPSGIYIVKVHLANRIFKGVCYIGKRPTFKNTGLRLKNNIEVHILNFHKNIYGKKIEIHFFDKIREDKRFKSAVELAKQIKKDVICAQKANL